MRRPALSLIAALTALLLPQAAHARVPIEGRWQMDGGEFDLRAGPHGVTSHWLRQRKGLSCPKIEDQDGDMVLNGGGRSYTGTWTWSLHLVNGSCKAIGRGPLTVTMSADGRTADLEGSPPEGFTGHESHTLTRPGVRPAALRRLTPEQRALLAGGRRVAQRSPEPAFLTAVGLYPGARLESLPRLQRVPVGFAG
jgi:hypothetical protein